MRPRLLLAPYHGTERGYSGVEVGESSEKEQALRARKAVGGGKVAMEPSELLVNAAVAQGITSVATVHDSCGCLAAQAERFRRIIREQFVKMYEDHDVLQEMLDWARKDLAENAKGLLGKPPKNGSLNVKEVLEAEYAFA